MCGVVLLFNGRNVGEAHGVLGVGKSQIVRCKGTGRTKKAPKPTSEISEMKLLVWCRAFVMGIAGGSCWGRLMMALLWYIGATCEKGTTRTQHHHTPSLGRHPEKIQVVSVAEGTNGGALIPTAMEGAT